MEITIVRGGGISNIGAQLGPVNTELRGHAGGLITAKVEEIGFFELPAELPRQGKVVDGFTYAMTIVDGARQHTVGYGDDSEVEAARPLFELQKLLIANGHRFKLGTPRQGLTVSDGFSWEAWYNRMLGGGDPDLHVAGSCTFGTSGVELSLKPDNEGTVDDPELFVLRLTISRPPVANDVISEESVVWTGDVGPAIKRVRIQGDAEAEFEVFDAV